MPGIARVAGTFAALLATVALVACGSSDKTSTTKAKAPGADTGAKVGGHATVDLIAPPDSLDPAVGSVDQAIEAYVPVYTGLLAYKHAEGTQGAEFVPGVARDLPEVSADGKTYTLYLRKGLKFSDGRPVVASNVAFALARALRVNWPDAYTVAKCLIGVDAVLKGKAKKVSGVETDDATGRITFHLFKPYGQFVNALADPGMSPLPKDTPIKNMGAHPPAGVGPFAFADVVNNQSFALVKNKVFDGLGIEEVPPAHLDRIDFKIVSNPSIAAEDVLQNRADLFDPEGTLPASILPQIQANAKDRFSKEYQPSTFFFALNVSKPPFDNELVRRAATLALDKTAMARLANGFLEPACYMLPKTFPGHSEKPCPYYGDVNGPNNLAKAKELVQQAGATGKPVTVWGETIHPVKEWTHYYASVLNQIGLKAKENILPPSTFWNSIMDPKVGPQTPYGNNEQRSNQPVEFFGLLDARNIQLGVNPDFVDDPTVQKAIEHLEQTPATALSDADVAEAARVNDYIAQKSYMNVFGSLLRPLLTSTRINHGAVRFSPIYTVDYTSLALK